jgi:hypothetical protein
MKCSRCDREALGIDKDNIVYWTPYTGTSLSLSYQLIDDKLIEDTFVLCPTCIKFLQLTLTRTFP